MRRTLFLVALVTCLFESFAFKYPKQYQSKSDAFIADSNSLYFNFNNSNFLWNNEFFDNVVEGYTLIGYHVTPTFEYHFNKNIKIEAGAHLLQYAGLDKYTDVLPVYRATYHSKDFALVMGTLYGTVNHNLPEPINSFENYFTQNLETGLQAIWNKKHFEIDLWLDWQHFIFKDDSTQEELLGGFAATSYLLKNKNWEISIPTNAIVKHRGGQIDTSEANMVVAFNYGIGLQAKRNFSFKHLTAIEGEFQYLGFKDNSPTVESIYDNGFGYLTNLRLLKADSYLQFGYWQSDQFLSVYGHPMYQSKSDVEPAFNAKNRNLFTTKLFYSKNIYRGIYLGVMGEIFYNTDSGEFDFTTGINLVIKQNFFLKRFDVK